MLTQTPRDPWHTIWQFTISDSLLVALLLAIAAGLMATAWLPQMPSAGPAAYARWLSEVQARFGKTAQTLQALGLFSITRSFGFRMVLALLAGTLSLRLAEGSGRLLSQAERRSWFDSFPLLAQGGALLLLVGQLVAHLWGWQVEGLLVQGGERAAIPGTDSWVALDEDASGAIHSPGIVAFIEEPVPGARVSAVDGEGRALALQRAVESEPLTQLTLAIDEDRYLAIPEAQLVVQLGSEPGHPDDTLGPIRVRVYRSPPGRLETESIIQGSGEVTIDDVTLNFTGVPYARVTATFNPGFWPTGLGLVLAIVGVAGCIAWRVRTMPATDEES